MILPGPCPRFGDAAHARHPAGPAQGRPVVAVPGAGRTAGGAAARAHHPQANPAFIFPEMLHTEYVPATWGPKLVDYLSLGFWTATAFSPTDISAIKPWAKLMMITEAAVSVVIGALVIARAINILA